MKPSFLLLLFLLLLSAMGGAAALTAGSFAEAPSPPRPKCSTGDFEALLSCLPSEAAETHENVSSKPPASCCEAISATLDGSSGGAACLCGLNASRVVSLYSSCRGSNGSGDAASSLAEICRDSEALLGVTMKEDDAQAPSADLLRPRPRPRPRRPPPRHPPPHPNPRPDYPDLLPPPFPGLPPISEYPCSSVGGAPLFHGANLLAMLLAPAGFFFF